MNARHVLSRRGSGSLIVLCLAALMQGCSEDYNLTGIDSPRPGILRVYIKSDDADNCIVIAGDTVAVQEGRGDSLAVQVGQGRVYRKLDYAVIYKALQDYQELTKSYNLIAMQNGAFLEFLTFETYLPPGVYDSLKIDIAASFLRIGLYEIPIAMPAGVGSFVKFDRSFRIQEGRATAIRLQLKPFSSLQRVKDTYEFLRIVEVVGIEYH